MVRTKRIGLVAIGAGAVLFSAALVFLTWKFPFRREAMVERVERETGARVEIGNFRETWFPPGFAADKVRWSDQQGNTATIDRITLRGSYTGLLRSPSVVSSVQAKGIR